MVLIGIAVTILGFLISLLSLTLTSGVNARMVIILLGILMSLFGIIGLINPAYVKNAIWKR